MVEGFLKYALCLHQNLDKNLDSNKLDLRLGLALVRGQTGGAPFDTIFLNGVRKLIGDEGLFELFPAASGNQPFA